MPTWLSHAYFPLLCACVWACSEPPRPPSPEATLAEERLRALSREPAAPAPRLATVHPAQVLGGDARAPRLRLVVPITGAAPFRRRERAHEGTRAVTISFEDARLDPAVPEVLEIGRAGLLRVRADLEPGFASLSFELAPEARFEAFVLEAPRRLVVDVERPLATFAPRAPLVMIDPGHGGEDLGSPGPFGLYEGRLTLDISRRVRAWLAHLAPKIRVRLTRDSDVYLTLDERAAMANALGASLFVSVHLNAASTTVDHGGVATFVLDVSNDRNVLRLAARENGTSTQEVSPLQFLVGSLVRTEQRAASMRLAQWVQAGTLASGRRFLPTLADRGVKSAMFYVLVGAQMPAVLVEGSFISQPDEARQLATEGYRDALAEGIARGIAKYLAQN